MEYLTAKQTINKLKQGRVTDISEAYFSQLVSTGALPFHTIPGKKRKLYLYDEVKKALADIQDPTRDAQREAIARKKKLLQKQNLSKTKEELTQRYSSAKSLEVIKIEDIKELKDANNILTEAVEQELQAFLDWNYPLHILLDRQKEAISKSSLSAEDKDAIIFEMLKVAIELMFTREDLNTEIKIILEEHQDFIKE